MKIIEKNECTGCMACYQSCSVKAITMQAVSKGFLYPIIDEEKCINCGLCQKVCPQLKEMDAIEKETCYAVWNTNEEERALSTSGGFFSVIARYVLEKSGVVYGAAYNENLEVVHARADKIEDMEKFRGSKYVQSYIGEQFKACKKDLDAGKLVLFSGTPCQIGGG